MILSLWWDIIRYRFIIYLIWGWALIHSISHFDIFRLLVSLIIGWLHAPYRKLYIRMYYWIISLLLTSIMHSAASRVFIFPCKCIISCFYQLIGFIANCQHLTEHQTHMRLLVCIIRSWKVMNPRTSSVLSVYGTPQNEIIR